jgi:hypothetical protein
MIKKILLSAVIISQLALVSCSSKDSPTDTPQTVDDQVANLIKLPYSALKPEEQKIKLEAEANEMLLQMDKMKTSSAIEAMQNLGDLLTYEGVELLNGKANNEIEDVINVADFYGVFTWNNTKKIWAKTPSTTELKFIFPAKKNGTANNAVFTSNAVASAVKAKITDTEGGFTYDFATDSYITTASVDDSIFLPSSVDAKLTIDGIQAGTISSNAKYVGTKTNPDEAGYKITTNDGYTWESNAKKADINTFNAKLTYNDKNLIDFRVDSSAKIDELINGNDVPNSYQGKGNVFMKIMENFIILGEINAEGLANDAGAYVSIPTDYRSKTYYADRNTNEKNSANAELATYNKNTKLILVSKKDGTKIAELIMQTEKHLATNNQKWVVDTSIAIFGGYWTYDPNSTQSVEHYDNVPYLKFNDNTVVAMDVYFSTGFSNLETKFTDFIKGFERK